MDIVRFMGGLGNQMFQYAFLSSLRAKGRIVYGSMDFYDKYCNISNNEELIGAPFRPYIMNEIFDNVKFDVVDSSYVDKAKKEKSSYYIEKNYSKLCEDVYLTKDCIFDGYWQTEKYFKDIRKKLLHDFEFTRVPKALRDYGDYIDGNYISVHVRHGDYIKYQFRCHICPESYYRDAMNYMKKFFPDAGFIFFSDDLAWCKETFNCEIFDGKAMFSTYQDWYDMYLMTRCVGNIIANSSFSWWGAWLNQSLEKMVIAPKNWYKRYPDNDIRCDDWLSM